jgi:hypothetical protein
VERRIPVIRAIATALLLALLCGSAHAQNSVLLVADENSPIETLSSFDVRKLYLGITVFWMGRMIRPLRNDSEATLNDRFLQSVVGMSEESYERRLLANVFRFGTARPDAYRDKERLFQTLRQNPYAVTYIWVTDKPPPGLKVLRVLWKE